MSSRALRKLKREEEEARQLTALRVEQEAEDGSEEVEDEAENTSSTRLKTKSISNAFDMLDGANETDHSEAEDISSTRLKTKPISNAFDMLDGANETDHSEAKDADEEIDSEADAAARIVASPSIPPKPTQAKKKKKKKQKKKAKEKDPAGDPSHKAADELDDIDRALKELSTREPDTHAKDAEAADRSWMDHPTSEWEAPATKLLGIDSKHLNPINEMKSLFGSIALEGSSTGRASPRAPQRQREQNQQGGVDLGTALAGRHSPASKGRALGALANRRNVFVQGHEDWPLGTSGGLSMDFNKNNREFGKHFSIVHNTAYTDVQREFHLCVESMQAENMIQLLMRNPYHVATLLQVSEIAKHQGDHSVSCDLLERALFSIGRSVHSSFPAALREGTARISFTNPNNRELYLAIWRYIQNLSMRGTWRTAYEWTKALLQLDTLGDPYGITLMIDQVALRGRQYAAFIELCSERAYGHTWSYLPNIQISLSLAYLRSSQPKLARETLALAMHKYPYILSALASSLDISPLPKYLWGKVPDNEAEKLHTELYLTRTKDLWNTPETTSLIAEVAETLTHYQPLISSYPRLAKLRISLGEARHIMLLEIPALIALLPRDFRNMPTSSFDVLPPPNSRYSTLPLSAPDSSGTDASASGAIAALLNAATAGAAVPIGSASSLLARALNWFYAPADGNEPLNENGETDGAAALRELHERVPPEVMQDMFRMHMLEAEDEREHEGEGEDEDEDHLNSESPQEELGMGDTIRDALFRSIAAGRGADDESDEVTDSETASGLPDLEDVPTAPANDNDGAVFQGPVQRSMAATVEDEFDDDLDDPNDDHDAEYLLRPHPPSTHGILAPQNPHNRHRRAPVQDVAQLDLEDPQRVQRWLISTGLQQLQDDASTLAEYVERLKVLRVRDRDWTVSILKQRAGAEVADRVKRELER